MSEHDERDWPVPMDDLIVSSFGVVNRMANRMIRDFSEWELERINTLAIFGDEATVDRLDAEARALQENSVEYIPIRAAWVTVRTRELLK